MNNCCEAENCECVKGDENCQKFQRKIAREYNRLCNPYEYAVEQDQIFTNTWFEGDYFAKKAQTEIRLTRPK
ncbi:hypothetical protein FACS189419_04870 [Planctomycetales bacterium]|nr:hypothetical protein FACS189419_04870 [Planctomycetales bacterium]